jgi:hypothetical protein
MRVACSCLTLAVVVAGTMPLLAQTPAGVQPSPYGSFFAKPARPAPASGLHFAEARRFQPSEASANPAVVCGLTVIPADPKHDPAMRRVVPQSGTAFTMRAVEPSICR